MDHLNGASRLYFIVGCPIAQVKSPASLTREFGARSANGVLVPLEVPESDIDAFFDLVGSFGNVDGLGITVPYKFAAQARCKTLTERAALLGATNVLRRNADGSWHGDMTDGVGFCTAALAKGATIRGSRALLIGAGGAGTAIGLALLDEGAAELAVYDLDDERAEALVEKLHSRYPQARVAREADPEGFDFIANATPVGMRAEDPTPVPLDRLASNMHVGDVITAPEVPPLIAHARTLGCTTNTGTDMYEAQVDVLADFLLGGG